MKKLIKEKLLKLASSNNVARLCRAVSLRHKITVLMYHEICSNDSEIEAWTFVKQRDFVRQMDYLRSNFEVLTQETALELMARPEKIRSNCVVVTFDDGYCGNKQFMLPVIESLGVPVTVFIATGAVQSHSLYWYDEVILLAQPSQKERVDINLCQFGLGRYRFQADVRGEQKWSRIQKLLSGLKGLSPWRRDMVLASIREQTGKMDDIIQSRISPLSVADVEEMSRSKWVTIGAHSHCHNILPQLDSSAILASISMSRMLLESWSGRTVTHFAYPNGDYDDRVIAALRNSGFLSAMTTEACPWRAKHSSFRIPRIGIGRYDSFDFFKAKVSGISF